MASKGVVREIQLSRRFGLADFVGEKSHLSLNELAFSRACRMAREQFRTECLALDLDPDEYAIHSWSSSHVDGDPGFTTIHVTMAFAPKEYP
jgi:hypothetical protein